MNVRIDMTYSYLTDKFNGHDEKYTNGGETWNYYGLNTEMKQTINMEWKRSSDSEIYSICICIYSIQKIGSHYIHTDSVNINISCFKSTIITYRIFNRAWGYFSSTRF